MSLVASTNAAPEEQFADITILTMVEAYLRSYPKAKGAAARASGLPIVPMSFFSEPKRSLLGRAAAISLGRFLNDPIPLQLLVNFLY
jgi:hypothetical protein